MAAPTVYKSSDASAPTLSGTAGDLVNLLDKCLVSGYGSKSAAGWTRKTAFAGASSTRAVFQQPAGNGFYLDVDDRGASGGLTGASGREAAVRAYEAMTDVSTGTNPFPTTAQVAAATANWRKSVTADATTRAWVLVADDRTFYLFILTGDTAGAYFDYFFGDVYSYKSADGFRTSINVRTAANSTGTGGTLGATVASLGSSQAGYYFARVSAGTGASIAGYIALPTGSVSQITLFSNPNTADSEYLVARPLVATSVEVRGYHRGIWSWLGPISFFADGDTFTGGADLASRTFLVIKGLFISPLNAIWLVETTAWDTSS